MAKDTRTRMIETTARLLQHRGYYGTALSDILDASGAPRGSLYFHFPGGKDQLVVEATRATVDATTQALVGAINQAKNPAAAVRVYTEGAAELMRASDYTFGCPVAPVILDAEGGLKDLERALPADAPGLDRAAARSIWPRRHPKEARRRARAAGRVVDRGALGYRARLPRRRADADGRCRTRAHCRGSDAQTASPESLAATPRSRPAPRPPRRSRRRGGASPSRLRASAHCL